MHRHGGFNATQGRTSGCGIVASYIIPDGSAWFGWGHGPILIPGAISQQHMARLEGAVGRTKGCRFPGSLLLFSRAEKRLRFQRTPVAQPTTTRP